jgi:vancomycin resistance protein YoaR
MKRRYLSGVLAAALCLIFAAPVYAKETSIPEGIYIGDLSLGGMTREDAERRIKAEVEMLSEQTISLDVAGTTVDTTAGELGLQWMNPEAVQEAAAAADGNLIRQYMKRKDLEKEPLHMDLEVAVDAEALDGFVQEKCADLTTQPQNAVITRVDGAFRITPEQSGVEIDLVATEAQIDEALAEMKIGKPITVSAVITEKQPDITAAMLSTISDVLGTCSTDFSSSGAARSGNLKNGASKIDGHVLMPGETLSGYECMHPFTTENGYYTAAAYENGQVVDSVGGGVCQIATTLYNAALLAELEITQRQNHSMIVTYVKPSMDAAIAGTYKDIKITNNYSTPIYVEGGVSGKTLTFTIYGKESRPANRTVEYVSETLSTTDPGAPTERVDNSLAPGTRKQVQSAHIGRKSRLWKVVTVDGVETERTLLNEDTYNPAKAIVLVGPAVPVETSPVIGDTVTQIEAQPTAPQENASQPGPSGPGVSGVLLDIPEPGASDGNAPGGTESAATQGNAPSLQQESAPIIQVEPPME